MPFELFSLSSYFRSLEKLGTREKEIVEIIVWGLECYFRSPLLHRGDPYFFDFEGKNYHLVFKKLRHHFWEAYIENKIRVVTRLERNRHVLLLAGNHDQVRQFLRKN